MDKSELRKKYLIKRRKLSNKIVIDKSLYIQQIFLQSNLYKKTKDICCYLDSDNEVKTDYLINKALEDGKNVYVPKIFKNGNMEFCLINNKSEFYVNKFNIKEPKVILKKFETPNIPSVFIVPGVVFSNDKYRIGYGGGYYDRWIKNNPNNIYVGFSYSFQIIDIFDKNEYDEKIDYIISEDGCQ